GGGGGGEGRARGGERAGGAGSPGEKVGNRAPPTNPAAPLETTRARPPAAAPISRHSTAHLTAQAVKRLFPEVQIGIGPPIENGYYYDFLPARPFTPEDLAAIEAEMRRIIQEDFAITREEMPVSDAIAIFEAQHDP